MAETLFRRIVVPTDFSVPSEEAWALAQRLARAVGAEVVLAHVLVPPPIYGEQPEEVGAELKVFDEARAWVEKELERSAADARATGLEVRTALRTGTAHEEIVELATAERAELVVIGTHGRTGLTRALMGSVAERVIRLAPCPVLSVRKPEPE
jgi:nucleotide-binding universal stress UspA family protein